MVAFLDRVFGEHRPHDFARLLPARYQPTEAHMRTQLALREGGRILALVGVFPLRWQLAGRTLRIAALGGVSVDPGHRGRGLMGDLLQAGLAAARQEGAELSWLAGQRQRYRRQGWERAGSEVHLTLTPKNLPPHPPACVSLAPPSGGQAEAEALGELHRVQSWRCERAPELCLAHLRSWHQRPLVARSATGQLLGYLTAHPELGTVHELVAPTADHRVAIAKAWVQHRGERTTFITPTPLDPLCAALAPFAESCAVTESGSWQVLSWRPTLDAILSATAETRPVPKAVVVLAVAETGERLRLWSDGDRAGCDTTTEAASLCLPAPDLLRTLFGPLPPQALAPLPAAARSLTALCPLPLGLPRQDQV